MPPGHTSIFGDVLVFASIMGTIGLGLMAAVGLVVVFVRRRRHRDEYPGSRLPGGWRVIRGGKRLEEDGPPARRAHRDGD